ncbi:MAG: hypothetical protein IT331_20205 [Anaerolineae bacterium]|nr:hypothetical protein [Anaerolineae bacterium]
MKIYPLVMLVVVLGLVALTPPVHAATVFNVNSYSDLPDKNPGDQKCETKKKNCTLRAAVMESNAMCGGDYGCEETIILPKGTFVLKRVGADDSASNGDLDITGSVTIQGAGAADTVIDGNSSVVGERVFHILGTSSHFVDFEGVTITNGKSKRGGGILNRGAHLTLKGSQVLYSVSTKWGGGGIYSKKNTLELIGSTIAENESKGDFGFGAGVYVDKGFLNVSESAIIQNSSTGTFNNGGGIYIHNAEGSIFKSAINNNSALEYGGGLRIFGGALTISESTVNDNYAEVSGGGLFIDTSAKVKIENSTISGNTSDINVGDGGGALYTDGELTIIKTKILGNSATRGGGIYKGGGTATLTRTTIDNNYGAVSGGGIYHFWGDLDISMSTLSRNKSNSHGGGMYQYTGNVTLTNSTVSSNQAKQQGGGIYIDGSSSSPKAQVNLYSVTLAANTAGVRRKGGGNGGGVANNQGLLYAQNTIFADNIAYDSPTGSPNECWGNLNSGGYNLIETGGGCTIMGNTTGNVNGTDPQLGPLQGSPTETHKISLSTPAIDAANPAGCKDKNSVLLEKDQRNHKRHVEGNSVPDDRCDIGAYENGDAISPNP